jgi:DNA-binding GntR family transcriptional regulator
MMPGKQQIYDALLQDIIRGEYPPEAVLNEKTLMERYGVSRAALREALVDLRNENVLRSLPRYGYEIKLLSQDDINSVMQYRMILEMGNLPLVYQKATRQELESLMDKVQPSHYNKSEDVWSDWRMNTEFHTQLHSLGKNPYINEQIKRCLSIQNRAFAQSCWDVWHKVRIRFTEERHQKLLEALLADKLYQAMEMLEQDLSHFSDAFEFTI